MACSAASAWTCSTIPACTSPTSHSVSPCGHIFCAQCLVQWFKVELHVNEPDENRGTVRRKKVCPSCRAHVVVPPLELWALKGVLDAVRGNDAPSRTRTISKDVWEGLFDPATFYHIIRDQEDGVLRCGACASEILEGECTNPEWYVRILTGSGIVYEDWEDDGEDWHRSEAVNVESDDEAQSTDDEAGSLEDFVVDDEEEEDAGSQASYRSSDSGIVCVSPPHETNRERDVAPTRPADSNTRRARLNALLASRARRHGTAARVRAPSSDEEEEEEEEASPPPTGGGKKRKTAPTGEARGSKKGKTLPPDYSTNADDGEEE